MLSLFLFYYKFKSNNVLTFCFDVIHTSFKKYSLMIIERTLKGMQIMHNDILERFLRLNLVNLRFFATIAKRRLLLYKNNDWTLRNYNWTSHVEKALKNLNLPKINGKVNLQLTYFKKSLKFQLFNAIKTGFEHQKSFTDGSIW